MFKKLMFLILCATILLSCGACIKDTTSDISSTESVSSNQTTNELEESVYQTQKSDSEPIISELEENDDPAEPVFNTENIVRITFYAYYGQGTGSDVPSENMEEITNWLSTITIDRKATDEDVAPGTNTRCVEIEYSDGAIIKSGLDVISVDGTRYLLKKDKYPDCFKEIISKTSYK